MGSCESDAHVPGTCRLNCVYILVVNALHVERVAGGGAVERGRALTSRVSIAIWLDRPPLTTIR